MPLSALPAALEHPAAADELLAGLDRQAAAEMEQLASRRATIAELRHIEAPPDLPPELSTWRSAAVDGLSAEMARYEHEVLVLFAHLLGRDGTPHFAAILGPGDEHIAAVAPLTARFYALEADTPADEIASLIDQIVAQLAPQAAGFVDSALLSAPGEALMDELSALALTPVQYRALREIERRLVRAASASGG